MRLEPTRRRAVAAIGVVLLVAVVLASRRALRAPEEKAGEIARRGETRPDIPDQTVDAGRPAPVAPAMAGRAPRGSGNADPRATVAERREPPPGIATGEREAVTPEVRRDAGFVAGPETEPTAPAPTASIPPHPGPGEHARPRQAEPAPGMANALAGDGAFAQPAPPSAQATPAPPPAAPPGADWTPPRLLAVRFEPAAVKDGDGTTLVILARDDAGRAVRANGSLRGPSGKSQLNFFATPAAGGEAPSDPSEPSTLVATLVVPRGAEGGTWRIAFLRVYDAAENSEALTPERNPVLAAVSLEVRSAAGAEGPALVSVGILPQEIEAPGTLRIAVTASDPAGVASAYGTLTNPAGTAEIRFYMQPGATPGTFASTVELCPFAEEGVWRLRSLTLVNGAGKRSDLGRGDPALERAQVSVRSSEDDTDSPRLVAVEIEPPTAEQGKPVRVKVRAWDNRSGVAPGSALLVNPAGSATLPFALTPAGDDLLEGRLDLPRGNPGTWRLDRVELFDRCGNVKSLTAANEPILAGATLEVY